MTPLGIAKERLGIAALARLRGWEWTPGKSCRCPYRPDRNESGSVLPCGTLFHDFATGESFDAPALLARVEGLEIAAACRLFIQLAGVRSEDAPRHILPEPERRHSTPIAARPPTKKPTLPILSRPAAAHLRQIAAVRGLSVDGLNLAVRRGFLWATRMHGAACWALADKSGWLCQLRRLDGQPFKKLDGGTFKARTCKGSRGNWPLGILEAAPAPNVALVEGGPDFLAAFHFIVAEGSLATCAPVAFLGASNRIPADALPHFAGKRVRIFAHVDAANDDGERAGMIAATRWEEQLADAGAVPTTFDLSGLLRADGEPVKDLNDVARMSADAFAAEPALSCLMTF